MWEYFFILFVATKAKRRPKNTGSPCVNVEVKWLVTFVGSGGAGADGSLEARRLTSFTCTSEVIVQAGVAAGTALVHQHSISVCRHILQRARGACTHATSCSSQTPIADGFFLQDAVTVQRWTILCLFEAPIWACFVVLCCKHRVLSIRSRSKRGCLANMTCKGLFALATKATGILTLCCAVTKIGPYHSTKTIIARQSDRIPVAFAHFRRKGEQALSRILLHLGPKKGLFFRSPYITGIWNFDAPFTKVIH